MGKQQDLEALRGYFGEYIPLNKNEARAVLDHADLRGQSFPASVYMALQNLLVSDMGDKISPKKSDRQRGRRIRLKRTGSRRG